MANEKKKIGRVVLAVKPAGYGFILTDDEERFFFHKNNAVGRTLFDTGTLVRFDPVKIDTPGKKDRAINVEAVQ